jgi:hypothetical protein
MTSITRTRLTESIERGGDTQSIEGVALKETLAEEASEEDITTVTTQDKRNVIYAKGQDASLVKTHLRTAKQHILDFATL